MTAAAAHRADDARFEDTATWHAEQALLGALLRHPDRIQALPWLTDRDFADSDHSAVFATLHHLHTSGELRPTPDTPTPAGPDDRTRAAVTHNIRLVREALNTRSAARGIHRDHGPLLTDLYDAGAHTTPAQSTRYGQMILELSVRRELDRWGLLMASAGTADTPTTDDPHPIDTTRAAMLQDLATRTTDLRRAHGDTTTHLPNTTTIGRHTYTPVPSPAQALVRRAERQVIHAVLTDPELAQSLLHRLQPEDFVTSTAHQTTWRAIQHIAHRGHPIDPITVAWELETTSHSGLTPAELTALRPDTLRGDAHRAVALIARSALAQHTHDTTRTIRTAAADRTLPIQGAITTATTAADRLGHQAARLTGASRPATLTRIERALAGDPPAAWPGAPPAAPRAR